MAEKKSEKINLWEILILIAVLAILAAILIPNLKVAIQKAKIEVVNNELEAIKVEYLGALKEFEIDKAEVEPTSLKLDYKAQILKSFPGVSESDKKDIVVLMSDEGINKLKSIKSTLDEAIKKGETTITRDDAITIKLDLMDTKISEIGKKILTKWDVAMVFFYILGALAALTSFCTFLIKILRKEKN